MICAEIKFPIRHVLVWSMAFAALFAVAARADEAVDSCISLFLQGRFSEAAEGLGKARAETPSDNRTGYYYARLLTDGAAAMEIYRAVAGDSSLADSVRAGANMLLGHAFSAMKETDSAAGYFGRACALDKRFCRSAGPTSADPSAGNAGPGFFYTIQTGAFGAEANAEKMKKELGRNFSGVEIAPLDIAGGTTLYRVRLGNFDSKEQAEEFAARELKGRGVEYCVVRIVR
jgi:hypothetical protein